MFEVRTDVPDQPQRSCEDVWAIEVSVLAGRLFCYGFRICIVTNFAALIFTLILTRVTVRVLP